jgi:hypothetical protein
MSLIKDTFKEKCDNPQNYKVCDRCDEIILKETEVCQCGSTEFIDDISEALLREYDFLKQFCLI